MEQHERISALLLLERPHAAAQYRALGEAGLKRGIRSENHHRWAKVEKLLRAREKNSARLDGHPLDSLGQTDGVPVADAFHRRGKEGREAAAAAAFPSRGGGRGAGVGGSRDPDAGLQRRGWSRRQRRGGGRGEQQRHLVEFSRSLARAPCPALRVLLR